MKVDKKVQLTQDALEQLIQAAHRVSYKYGHDDNDVPSDWKEWVELRRSIIIAKQALARFKTH